MTMVCGNAYTYRTWLCIACDFFALTGWRRLWQSFLYEQSVRPSFLDLCAVTLSSMPYRPADKAVDQLYA